MKNVPDLLNVKDVSELEKDASDFAKVNGKAEMTNYQRRKAAFRKILESGKRLGNIPMEEKLKLMSDEALERLLEKQELRIEQAESNHDFTYAQLRPQNVRLMKEYMVSCDKFSFEGYQVFLRKKCEKMKGNPNSDEKEYKKTQAIFDNIAADNQYFKKEASDQHRRLVTELLTGSMPHFDRFVWAKAQLDTVQCELSGDRFLIRGKLFPGTATLGVGMFDIKAYDLSPHMRWIEKFKRQKEARERRTGHALNAGNGVAAIGNVAVGAVRKMIEGDPIANLENLKSDIQGGGNVISMDPMKLYNILYNLQNAYGLEATSREMEIENTVKEDLRANY